MTPMERKLRNTPQARALQACAARNHDQQYGIAIERGQATLMRLELQGGNSEQIAVAGPVLATDKAAVLDMVDGYMDFNYRIRTDAGAMRCCRSVLAHAGIDFSDMTPDAMIDASRKISAPCNHQWDRPYRGHGERKCTRCGGLQSN